MATLNTADLPSEDEGDLDFVPALKSLHGDAQDAGSSGSSSESENGRPKKKRKKNADQHVAQEETYVST